MALDGPRKKKNKKKETIANEDLPAILDAMREANFFNGLDKKNGYGKGQPLNAGRRLYVRKLLKDVRNHFDMETSGDGKVFFRSVRPIDFYSPSNANQKENTRESLGLNAKAWKKFPVPLLPGYKGDKVKIRASTDANKLGLAVDYPDWGLRHFFFPFDYPAILNAYDFRNDELTDKDNLIEAYKEWAGKVFAPYDDGNSWFRLTTQYGDVSATKYGPAQSLGILLNSQLPSILNKYYSVKKKDDDVELEAPMMLTGLSVYRKIGTNKRRVSVKNLVTYEYNRPKKKSKKLSLKKGKRK